jgi:hypothetical protein
MRSIILGTVLATLLVSCPVLLMSLAAPGSPTTAPTPAGK